MKCGNITFVGNEKGEIEKAKEALGSLDDFTVIPENICLTAVIMDHRIMVYPTRPNEEIKSSSRYRCFLTVDPEMGSIGVASIREYKIIVFGKNPLQYLLEQIGKDRDPYLRANVLH